MNESTLPENDRDVGWFELRERLASAARETHFFAFSAEASNSAAILMISGRLADLAMSIPLEPSHNASVGLTDASTLFATQILQLDHHRSNTADLD